MWPVSASIDGLQLAFTLQSTPQYFMDWAQLETETRIFNTEIKWCIKMRGGSGEDIKPIEKLREKDGRR